MRAALSSLLLVALGAPAVAGPPPSVRSMARLLDRKQLYRRLSPDLKQGAFRRKLAEALDEKDGLVRSYAGVFWRLVRKQPPPTIGGIGRALGDAHHENINFVEVDGKTVFGMTDLDDGGEAPVSEDAAHYFTVLRLRYGKELTRKMISGYVAAVADPARAVPIGERQVPDWKAERRRDLARYTKGDRFRESKDLERAGRGTRELIRTTQSGDPRLARLQIRDVATVTRVQGGSGGLTRYWLLVEDAGVPRILELKQIGRAGVDELRLAGRTTDPAARVRSLQKSFWGFEGKHDWYVTQVGGAPFLVRDRSSIEKVELDKLKPKQLERVLLAQAGYLAGIHRPAWAGVTPEAMEEYLAGRTRDLAKAYQRARKRMR